jgi:hypothetical protein
MLTIYMAGGNVLCCLHASSLSYLRAAMPEDVVMMSCDWLCEGRLVFVGNSTMFDLQDIMSSSKSLDLRGYRAVLHDHVQPYTHRCMLMLHAAICRCFDGLELLGRHGQLTHFTASRQTKVA